MASRRQFLQQASTAALAASSTTLFGRLVSAQAAAKSDQTARIFIDSRRTISPLDRNLFGSFLEQLGRAIYDGIYDPGSKLSDSNGFRKDVMQEVRTMGVPIIRYPGGNFVSGYNWLDGVGPKQDRPKVLDKAWDSLNTNQFGTNEYMAWCKAVGTLPLMGLNLGTGTPEQAAALLEYCNVEKGTQWSDLRRKHGYEQPYNVKHWCMGNEMDGPWQIGHMTATEYGMKAQDTARQMRYVAQDPSLKLIACGSSGPFMPTYLEWDREVLEQCYDYVDGLSLHRYLGNNDETGEDSAKYLAMNLTMDKQIAESLAVCDLVRGHKRSPKKLWLSFDEWNVWYRARSGLALNGQRQFAPHLLEEEYNLEDALLVGGFLNTLLRQSERVRVGCLAQLVNVIAPLVTNADRVLRQTIYYPYAWALKYARGRVVDLLVESEAYPIHAAGLRADFARNEDVPYLDVVVTVDSKNDRACVFMLNRDLNQEVEVSIDARNFGQLALKDAFQLRHDDLQATNTRDAPGRVKPQPLP